MARSAKNTLARVMTTSMTAAATANVVTSRVSTACWALMSRNVIRVAGAGLVEVRPPVPLLSRKLPASRPRAAMAAEARKSVSRSRNEDQAIMAPSSSVVTVKDIDDRSR